MHERIKKLRKALSLTQQEFADKIKISRGALATYEVGRNEPIDAVIFSICREFNVNEEWLRTGAGEMFVQRPRNELLEEQLRSMLTAGNDSFRERLIALLLRLPSDQWKLLEEYALELVGDKPEQNKEPPETWDGKTREELHAELDRRLDEEKELALSRRTAAEAPPDAASPDTMMEAG